MRYEGITCPLCQKEFTAADDVVVCPQCGTPHHRACYEAYGHCANEALHSEGFSFTAQNPQTAEKIETNTFNAQGNNESLICPLCKHENKPGSVYCEYCGQKFTLFGYNVLEQQKANETENGQNNGEFISPDFNHKTMFIDDTDVNEISEYIRSSSQRYLNKFRKLSDKKISWNWAAFFFSPYWFFYRKMIKPGIIFLTASLCLTIIFSSPLNKMAEIYYEATELMESSTIDQATTQQAISDTIGKANDYLPFFFLFVGCFIILKIISALIADRLYKNRVITNIKRIKEAAADSETYHMMVFKIGGISPLLVIISYLAEYFLAYLADFIMTKF